MTTQIGAGLAMPQIPGSALNPLQRFNASAQRGLGRLGETLFAAPAEVASQIDPRTLAALQRQSLLQMGLGMLAARDRGLGAGALLGLQQGQQTMGQGLGQAWAGQRTKREDERLDLQEQRTAETLARQQRLDAQALTDRQTDVAYRDSQAQYQREQDAARAQERAAERALDQQRFDAQMKRMAATDARANDKEDLQNRRFASSIRKEFRGLPSVKDYETVLPIVESARKAPATPAGDLQIIYSVGKVLDPGSVVREGELQLTQNAQPWLSKLVGQYQQQVKGGAALPKAIRDQFIAALDERVAGYRAGYERDVDQYRRYAQEQGLDPFVIVGTDLVEPYRTPASRPAGAPSQQDMDIVGNWLNKGQP